jgi:Trk K+ transport system NAD-binding subunit
MHLVLPTTHSKRGRQATAVISGILLAVTVLLVSRGMWLADGKECQVAPYADRIYRFFLFLGFGGEGLKIKECSSDWSLEWARFTGPAGVFAGFLALIWGLIEDGALWLRRQFLSHHAVVIGLGQRGRTLSRHAAKSQRVVGIDVSTPDGALPQRCESVIGDGREEKVLRKARIAHAKFVFATTGDDLLNLQIARNARDLGCKEVYALVGDAFARRVADNAEFASINAVSLEEIAARGLTAQARFHELAEIQGHDRVHLAVFGDGPLAGAIVAQVVRTALTSTLGKPAVTVLAADPDHTRKEMLRSYPGLEAACDFKTYEFDPADGVLDQPDLFAEIAARAPVSGIVVIDGNSSRAVLFAGALQGALRRAAAWPAPIFFSAAPLEAAAPFAFELGATRRLSDVLHPFETGSRLCTPENVAAIDEAARQMHASYLLAHKQLSDANQAPSTAVGALTPWETLAPTFRQANRRAADHIVAKLLSAGCYVPPGPPRRASDIDLLAGGRLERLSELEHRAWMADRLLGGWRPAKARNERRRLHDSLIDYGKLTPATKELDRAQVRDLVATTLPRGGLSTSADPGLARFDLWVGIIGSLDVEEGDIDWLTQAAAGQLDGVMAKSPGRHLTLVSPLAPGADLILTRKLLAHAADRGWPHRLIVVEALGAPLMVGDFEPRWRKGSLGDAGTEAATWPEVAKALQAARSAVVAGAPNARIVEAALPEEDHNRAYRWQNVYLIRNCDVLLAAPRGLAGRGAGGTAEALRWRADPSLIPADFAGIPSRPADEPRRTIVMNLKTRQVA